MLNPATWKICKQNQKCEQGGLQTGATLDKQEEIPATNKIFVKDTLNLNKCVDVSPKNPTVGLILLSFLQWFDDDNVTRANS